MHRSDPWPTQTIIGVDLYYRFFNAEHIVKRRLLGSQCFHPLSRSNNRQSGAFKSSVLCRFFFLILTCVKPDASTISPLSKAWKKFVFLRLYTQTVNCCSFPNPAAQMEAQECREEITAMQTQLTAALSAPEDRPTIRQPFRRWNTLGIQKYADFGELGVRHHASRSAAYRVCFAC